MKPRGAHFKKHFNRLCWLKYIIFIFIIFNKASCYVVANGQRNLKYEILESVFCLHIFSHKSSSFYYVTFVNHFGIWPNIPQILFFLFRVPEFMTILIHFWGPCQICKKRRKCKERERRRWWSAIFCANFQYQSCTSYTLKETSHACYFEAELSQ